MASADWTNKFANALRQGQLAYALAHLMVLGDNSKFTDDLLQGDIELDDELLHQHIEHVLKNNQGSFW